MKSLLVVMLVLFSSTSAWAQKPETLIDSGFDQKEMDAAIERAKKEVDTFIKELEKPTGKSHAIKVAITDKGKTEFFWLMEVTYRDGVFEGTINNEPGMVKNVRFGDKRKVKKADIADWLFLRDGKMHGNYTVRPLLKAMPKEQAEEVRAMLAEP